MPSRTTPHPDQQTRPTPPRDLGAPHTHDRPEHAAALAGLLARLATRDTRASGPVPGGELHAGRYDRSRRIAVRAGHGERVALVTLRPAAGCELDAATLGPLLAAILDNAPEESGDHPAADLSAATVHLSSRMRRDDRTPARRADGSAGWTVPGAVVHLERHTLTVTTPACYVRIALDGPDWTERAAAAVLDAALWWLAAPEARHMTRTTAARGWQRLGDVVPGAVGRDRHGHQAYSGLSTALCSCGWTSGLKDDRQYARAAARQHAQEAAAAAATDQNAASPLP